MITTRYAEYEPFPEQGLPDSLVFPSLSPASVSMVNYKNLRHFLQAKFHFITYHHRTFWHFTTNKVQKVSLYNEGSYFQNNVSKWPPSASTHMIYLLTAIGLSPGDSTHLHTNNTQNKTNNNRTTQIQTNLEECGPCSVFASFTLAFALQLRKKHGKTCQGKQNLSQVKINLSQSTVCILPKTPTHYKTLTNTHITKLTHTHTRAYTQYKTI
jgi:hypothetical protein